MGMKSNEDVVDLKLLTRISSMVEDAQQSLKKDFLNLLHNLDTVLVNDNEFNDRSDVLKVQEEEEEELATDAIEFIFSRALSFFGLLDNNDNEDENAAVVVEKVLNKVPGVKKQFLSDEDEEEDQVEVVQEEDDEQLQQGDVELQQQEDDDDEEQSSISI